MNRRQPLCRETRKKWTEDEDLCQSELSQSKNPNSTRIGDARIIDDQRYSYLEKCVGAVGIHFYLCGDHAKYGELDGTADSVPPNTI